MPNLWVSLYFEIIITEVTFHSKLEYRRSVVLSNLRFLCIITDAHTNVCTAPITPYVKRKLKPNLILKLSFPISRYLTPIIPKCNLLALSLRGCDPRNLFSDP